MIAERPDKYTVFCSSSDLGPYWSSFDQISPETAHLSCGDQSAPETDNKWVEFVADMFRPQPAPSGIKVELYSQLLGRISECSSRLDAWNRLNLVKGRRTRGTLHRRFLKVSVLFSKS